jgi:hypothetical protein
VSEREGDGAERIRWRWRLPRRRPVDRHEFLVGLSRNRRVIHVGFVDERQLEEKLAAGAWLHARLCEVASSVVGIDRAEEGVRWAIEAGFAARAADAQSPASVSALELEPAEVVIAGELIEHLDAPGPFLRAMHELVAADGRLVLTTPNAYRLLNHVSSPLGLEFVHPDHTAWHSPRTLRRLVERHGWRVEDVGYYHTPRRAVRRDQAPGALAGGHLANGARALVALLGRVVPYWSEGLIVVCRPESPPGETPS